MVAIRDERGLTRSFQYDGLGRQQYEFWVKADKVTVEKAIVNLYNAADQPVYSFEAASNAQVLQTPYRADNLPTFVASNLSDWTVNHLTATATTYDDLGDVSTVTTGAVAGSSTYLSDAAGRMVRVTDPLGGVRTTQYDLAGRVKLLTLDAGTGKQSYFDFGYYARTDALPSGQVASRKDQLLQMVGRTGPVVLPPTAGTENAAVDFHYDDYGRETNRRWWDKSIANGNPGQIDNEVIQTIYVPSGEHRGLVKEENRNGWVEPVYDLGNVHSKYTYGPRGQIASIVSDTNGKANTPVVNQLDAAGNTPYRNVAAATTSGIRPAMPGYLLDYDANGNITQYTANNPPADITRPRDRVDRYVLVYDHRNRLVSVRRGTVVKGGADTTFELWYTIHYAYDTNDNLVQRIVDFAPAPAHGPKLRLGNSDQFVPVVPTEYFDHYSGGSGWVWEYPKIETTRYVYDRGNLAVQIVGGKDAVAFLHLPDGTPLARADANGTAFYLTDARKSVLSIVDANGATLKRIRYANTGVAWRYAINQGFHDPFEVAGHRADFLTRFTLTDSGWLDAEAGRYISPNDAGLGFNPYPYAGNSAVNDVPSVQKPEVPWWVRAVDNPLTTANAWMNAGFFGLPDRIANAVGLGSNNFTGDQKAAFDAVDPWGFAAKIPGAFWDGVQNDTRGYRDNGYSDFGSAFWAIMNNAPVTGAGMRLAEVISGESKAGADLGRELSWGERALAFGMAFLEVLPGGRAAAAAGGRVAVKAGQKVAGSAFGRVAAAGGRSVAASSVGRSVGTAARWMSRLGPEAREGARWAERNLPTLNAALDIGIHGGLSRVSNRLHDAAANVANRLGFKACFSAGTPLYGKDGAKAIELFRSYEEFGDDCDWIVSRSEHDDDAPLVLRRVLRRFERQSLVLELLVGGQKIGTTAEHPFFAKGKGWIAAQELQPGDEVRLMSPGWAKVESVVDTGRVELVYNLEVEDDHTYFVGCEEWGFSVWAHNATGYVEQGTLADAAKLLQERVQGRILGENLARGEARFSNFRLAGRQVEEIVEHARGLNRIASEEVEAMLLMAHRADKPIMATDLMAQMTMLNTGRLRGFPAAFNSAEGFGRFSDDFTRLVGSHGLPVDGVLLQGSMLRKAMPPDLDVLVVGGKSLFEQMAAQGRRAVKSLPDSAAQLRELARQVTGERINMTFLRQLGGGTFGTKMEALRAGLVTDGILPATVKKVDFSLTYPGTWHAGEGLGPIWRLTRPGG